LVSVRTVTPGAVPRRLSWPSPLSILRAIYQMLEDGTMYQDLGRKHFDRRSNDQAKAKLGQTSG
jgi:hypothetical protein